MGGVSMGLGGPDRSDLVRHLMAAKNLNGDSAGALREPRGDGMEMDVCFSAMRCGASGASSIGSCGTRSARTIFGTTIAHLALESDRDSGFGMSGGTAMPA